MGARHAFTRVTLDTRAHGSDYPRAFELYVSNDGTNWGAPIAVGKNEQAVLRLSFPLQSARYIKFVQTGKTWHHWYIGNFEVFVAVRHSHARFYASKREAAGYARLARDSVST